ncbi:MAG: cytidine deaminase family protein, partial [Bacteroidia bacterium]
MSEIRRESILKRYTDINELNETDRMLLAEARKAVATSYAPYSNFHVGCALQLNNGVIVKGSNQENIAYPSGLCAERVAIFSAGATYPNEAVKTMAITVKADKFKVTEPIMSCGACLQS